MKATFGSVEVEGTPDEIATLIRSLSGHFSAANDRKIDPVPGGDFVSEKVAFATIRRRQLSDETSKILKFLLAKYPDWASFGELKDASNYSSSQLAGLLGAFGKRLYATPGYENGTAFFEQEIDYETGEYRYRIPESVAAAVRRAEL
jgi:hypothetical protein